MFDNSGKKLQKAAKAVFWICLIIDIIGGIVLISKGSELSRWSSASALGTTMSISGAVMLFLGPLFTWLGCLFIAAFGQLVENSQLLNNKASGPELVTTEEVIEEETDAVEEAIEETTDK